LASRLKRLSDRLYRSGERIYARQETGFHPGWFPVMARLGQAGDDPLAITAMAGDLGVTHPAIILVVREMERKGLVVSSRDEDDARVRRVHLTAEGRNLLSRLEPIWNAFEQATSDLFEEVGCDVIDVLERIEEALDREELDGRITAHLE
jgi:DNA-binding MarR family transcriptional regulator